MLNEDRILIIGLNNDSKEAFGAIYDKYAGKVYNYIALMLRDKTLAEDFLQVCFMTVWERRGAIDPEQSFAAYIYTIARNIVFKESRRLAIDAKYTGMLGTQITPPHASDADSDRLIEQIDREILDCEIKKLVETLPPGRRRVFELRFVQKMSNAQIAETLDISVKTVEAQITSASRMLRDKLAKFKR